MKDESVVRLAEFSWLEETGSVSWRFKEQHWTWFLKESNVGLGYGLICRAPAEQVQGTEFNLQDHQRNPKGSLTGTSWSRSSSHRGRPTRTQSGNRSSCRQCLSSHRKWPSVPLSRSADLRCLWITKGTQVQWVNTCTLTPSPAQHLLTALLEAAAE
jgi:hypothetical protein